MKNRTHHRAVALLTTTALALLGLAAGAAPAAAHACRESTAGDAGVRCGSCQEGTYHDHHFRDGTHCSSGEPCGGHACILEGVCGALPKLCRPVGDFQLSDLPLP